MLRTLREELIHAFCAPFNLLLDAAENLVKSKKERKVLRDLWIHAMEQSHRMIADMLDHGYRLPLGKRMDYPLSTEANPYHDQPQEPSSDKVQIANPRTGKYPVRFVHDAGYVSKQDLTEPAPGVPILEPK